MASAAGGYLRRDGPGHLGQEAEHGLGEVLVRDVMLQQDHLRLRALVSCVAQATYKMTLGEGERERKKCGEKQYTRSQKERTCQLFNQYSTKWPVPGSTK